jgi:hypothetical protein
MKQHLHWYWYLHLIKSIPLAVICLFSQHLCTRWCCWQKALHSLTQALDWPNWMIGWDSLSLTFCGLTCYSLIFHVCGWVWRNRLEYYKCYLMKTGASFVGHYPHRDRHSCIGSNFSKFYLIRISFTLDEPLSLVEVGLRLKTQSEMSERHVATSTFTIIFLTKLFRLFRLEWIFLVFRVWTQ